MKCSDDHTESGCYDTVKAGSAVAQSCTLPFRRIGFCWRVVRTDRQPSATRRYSRLQICATGFRSDVRLPALLWVAGKSASCASTLLKRLLTIAMIALLALLCSNCRTSQRVQFPDFIRFDAAQGEYPEGVAVDHAGNVFVSIGAGSGPRGAILKFTPAGEKSLLVDFHTPGAVGLAVDALGNVYVARATNNGVWRVDTNGQAVRLPGTEQIIFPNALAFDHVGNLYATETYSGTGTNFGPGGIWKIPPHGPTALWLRHELLTGLKPALFPFPVGANGIGFFRENLYVVNTDKALVVKVPVRQDGGPGEPEVWKQVADVPEAPFHGSQQVPLMLDGLALDTRGNVYVAVPSRAAIVRINASDLTQQTIAVYPRVPLDAPLSLAFGTGAGERESLFISNGGFSATIVPPPTGGPPWAGPGLVKIDAGVSGLPLP